MTQYFTTWKARAMAKRARLSPAGGERSLTTFFPTISASGGSSQNSLSLSENLPDQESCQEDVESDIGRANESESECEPEEDLVGEDEHEDEREDEPLPTTKPVCSSFCCTSEVSGLHYLLMIFPTGNN